MGFDQGIPQLKNVPCMELAVFAYDKDIAATMREFIKRAALLMGMSINELEMTKLAPHMTAEDQVNTAGLLPYAWEKWSVLKAPHIYKKHWSQFERRTYRHFLILDNANLPELQRLIWYASMHLPSHCWILARPSDYQPAILGFPSDKNLQDR
jgi:ribosomal protein S10